MHGSNFSGLIQIGSTDFCLIDLHLKDQIRFQVVFRNSSPLVFIQSIHSCLKNRTLIINESVRSKKKKKKKLKLFFLFFSSKINT